MDLAAAIPCPYPASSSAFPSLIFLSLLLTSSGSQKHIFLRMALCRVVACLASEGETEKEEKQKSQAVTGDLANVADPA
jgi:hypothetical protein